MAFLNRLKWLSVSMVAVGAITSAFVWGDPSRGRSNPLNAPKAQIFSDEVVGRFTNKPAVTYQTRDGDVYFALQVKPELAAQAPKPRDIIVLVDASASQAGAAFDAARRISREIVQNAGESDRLAVWSVSTPKATRNLVRTGGLKPAADVKGALLALDNEFPAGAIDLKDTLERVAKDFDGKATRQQVIIYLGDGESALNPLDEKTRYKLADDLRAQNIAFYAVPMGTPKNAHNVHALVSGTGGAVVRPMDAGTTDSFAAVKGVATKLFKALDVPVIQPTKLTLSTPAAEVFPTKLPPMRGDTPTLIVGRFEKGKAPKDLQITLEGSGPSVTLSHKLPEPTADNFFLGSMVAQWRNSGRSDSPALLRADRTLALAYESTRLAREEFNEQGDWALGAKKFDAAKQLFQAALKLDPEDPRSQAGVRLVDRIQKGEISLDELKKVSFNTPDGLRVDVRQLALGQDPKKDEPKAEPKAEPKPEVKDDAKIDPAQLLKQEEARQKIREQQTNVAVEETLNRARDLLRNGDPKTAKDILVAQRDSIRVVGDVGEVTRQKLLNQIGLLLDEVSTRGDAMIRAKAEENERLARAQQQRIAADQGVAREEKIRERIKNFATLMNQARYEDAYREALVMENEFVNEGKAVPIETQAVARIGQAAVNYRDFRELVRLREDRYLLAMMEVEKSHMPYPDEPTVHFPPAKVWRELAARRREYAQTDFDRDLTPRQKQRYQFLQDSLLQILDLSALKGGGDFTFGSLLKSIQELVSIKMKREVTLYINFQTFPRDAQGTLRDARVNLSTLMDATGDNLLREISFKTIMETLCRQVGASFWVTPDYIEIVSIDTAKTSRVFKVLPVEDLIVPIPNAVNQQAVQQQLQTLGQLMSCLGGLLNQPFGGGFQGNNQGNQGGNANLGGVFQGQGGPQGFGGGNVGQLGNLGGQFGFQGGRQAVDPATELVVMIQMVVDPGYWSPDVTSRSRALLTGQADDPLADMGMQVEANERNMMQFNLTTRSLVILGRSRFHRSTPGRPLKKDEMAAGNINNPDGRGIAIGNPPKDPKDPPAAVAAGNKPVPVDPEQMWRAAIEKGVTEPGKIIACADFLVNAREFKHAAELIKASLRQGLTPERWFQEALAIALEESQAAPEEIERARLSVIDLEPKNPQAYVAAADALNNNGNPDGALRLAKIAAKLQPNVPDVYVNALAYAENPKATASYDVSAFVATGLLGRDWPMETPATKAKAKAMLLDAVKKLDAQNKKADAERVKALLEAEKKRDLVVELLWSGPADLDLRVKEPTGSTCTATHPLTTGGGSLKGDLPGQKDDTRNEIYSATTAFNGTYIVTVDHVSGRSLGKKAQVKVTKYQGTPNETVEYHTLDLGTQTELKVTLEQGRRVDLALIPSPTDVAKYRVAPDANFDVMNKLRALTGSKKAVAGMSGGVSTAYNPATSAAVANARTKRHDDVSWTTRFGERSPGAEIQSTTTVRADGSTAMKATPVFDAIPKDARVKLDIIPGSEE